MEQEMEQEMLREKERGRGHTVISREGERGMPTFNSPW